MNTTTRGETAFFVVAHADDWQLFMFPHVYQSLCDPQKKTVILITTAGDAGKDENYWKSREQAAIESMRFCLKREAGSGKWGVQDLNGKHLSYWEAANRICYFLRLPDGGLDGNGFGQGSLAHLQDLSLKTLPSLDLQNSYTLDELVETLETIVIYESIPGKPLSLHYQNPDPGNHFDHPDHIATGTCMECILSPEKTSRFLYRSYPCDTATRALPGNDLDLKKNLFYAYQNSLKQACGYDTLAEDPAQYQKWLEAENSYELR